MSLLMPREGETEAEFRDRLRGDPRIQAESESEAMLAIELAKECGLTPLFIVELAGSANVAILNALGRVTKPGPHRAKALLAVVRLMREMADVEVDVD